MELSRRTFFKFAGAAGAAGLAGRPAAAEASAHAPVNTPSVLVDTTRCVGCRGCEAACAEANHLPGPEKPGEETVFESRRKTDVHTYTVVNRATGAKTPEPRFVNTQCMHCLDPACASACLAKALEKTPAGPVVYHPERCLGCRYCMVACQFDVPKFEFEKAAPYIQKCSFCAERQAQGLDPACASVCPTGALTFGRRADLLEEARTRIYQNPGKYVRHVYGETEAGGTNWLYITDVPFEQLGFRTDLGPTSPPELTRTALAAVPLVLTLWPPLLMGLYTFAKRREEASKSGAKEAHHD
ncbi:MAG: 4Fe-4S dicluster domain-containing protein [Candidatus Rokuibacteriota bacterium]|nr:MAG: 4Fe-4S dicluster domain-containing protein [Candidatus Rokubacteria bacterium]